jgi:hypothetical protein
MKKMKLPFLLILTTIFCMSFVTNPVTTSELLGTKWISPINDNCFDSLCFTSENTVMYFMCNQNIAAELGYKINGDKIEIEAYSKSSMDPNSKLVLIMDNGVLKQPSSQDNYFPKNFIIVPGGACN